MSPTVLVQARIDPAIKEQAAAVLERSGLTLSDAVRILLTRTAKEGALPFGLASSYDDWFRRQVEDALADDRMPLAHDAVETYFATLRAGAAQR